ncbi:STAS domain-containing protein [Herbaspirillum sp. SJZ107]|uniref:STAS domain-containing protein n=1 Tax=Herbaspirillum sp. SJZ107 TaxID=2572881 RepID=UPI00114E1D85|nr:STAS domain-containing protein [Herbaspirillum sp. SJZ107]TQK08234.1 rsbT co-antagonist protein RsbR [Herbaspirillum sp. SJZ107]
MTINDGLLLAGLVREHAHALGTEWYEGHAATVRVGANEAERSRDQCFRFMPALAEALATADLDTVDGRAWADARRQLDEISAGRANGGSTAAATATFIFFLKQPLFALLRAYFAGDAYTLARVSWTASVIIDRLGLYTLEAFQRTRDLIVSRQQRELLELSTPVINLWDGILALPLIGTLDSARAQVVMESLLDKIVASGAHTAIIDITGVPTVDTLVAQHLLKTIAAARLMGAECVLSGIRPQIAQTIVHLGIELDTVLTKATLADALVTAVQHAGARS